MKYVGSDDAFLEPLSVTVELIQHDVPKEFLASVRTFENWAG
jgi:hypothetical protein